MQIGLRLLLILVALFTGQLAGAQQTEPDFSSVVLVLKLVSATHVKPVTGIVVSDDGLVLVPADFVSEAPGDVEGEIIVLDGGTDIISHGRPAKVVNPSIPGGLAILSVEGLKRPGITLSELGFGPSDEFHLAAFPPAEQIAKGADPLWVPASVVTDEATAITTVSAETPLPYVTGAILDNCGYLAGLNMASGAQSLQTNRQTVTIFAGELNRALDSIQVSLPQASCAGAVQQLDEPASADDSSDLAAATVVQEEAQQEIEPVEPLPDETAESAAEEPFTEVSRGNATMPQSPALSRSAERSSLWLSIPTWLILSSLIVLIVAVWKIAAFLRLHTNEPTQTATARQVSRLQPASDEPETAQLVVDPETPVQAPRSGQVNEVAMPDLDDLPGNCNAVLVIEGQLDGDDRFKRFCAVNSDHFDIVIGRGNTDISIEHPAISREHARIETERDSMTLADMGSSNGTFIGAVPCLPGEVMFIGPADDIFLGDVCCRVSLVINEAGLS